jgi:hypothetical protein
MPGDFHRAFCISVRIDGQKVKSPPMIKIITASEIRAIIIILLRFFVCDGAVTSCAGGLGVCEGVRKKPAGGGVSGGLSLGCSRLDLGCGTMAGSFNCPAGLGFLPVSISRRAFSGGDVLNGVARSGGMVRKASFCLSGPYAISAPQWGQKRYFRVFTSGSLRLHLGQTGSIKFVAFQFQMSISISMVQRFNG